MTTDELLGRYDAGQDRSEDYIAWGVQMMDAGHDRMNFSIAAAVSLTVGFVGYRARKRRGEATVAKNII
jgi:hypothetical protein